MKEYSITKNDASQRLDKFLKRRLPGASTSFLYKMLRKKNIVLNDKKAAGNELLAEGDNVKLYFSEETFEKFSAPQNFPSESSKTDRQLPLFSQKEADALIRAYQKQKQQAVAENGISSDTDISILYENEHLVLLYKPAGILTQKAKEEDFSLNEWLLGYLLFTKQITVESMQIFKPSVLNRLDRNTSGIVICGKTLPGSRILSQLLKERSLHKFYRTLVYGRMTGEKTLTAFLSKNCETNQVKIKETAPANAADYDKIETKYQVLSLAESFSYLEIELITGKTHQIRAHLQSIGHPIIGDHKYGVLKEPYPQKIDQLPYQLLHAYRLVFPKMPDELADLSEKEILCPLPLRFIQVMAQLHFEQTQ